MARHFLDKRITLIRGDCIKVLPTLGRADHFIFDPPFEDEMHKAKKARARKLRTDGHAELKPLTFPAIGSLRERVTPLIARQCNSWVLAFCSPEGIAAWRDAIEANGIRYKRACFYCKTDAAPQFNGQGPAFAVEPFVTAWCGRSVSKWNGGGRKNWFPHQTNGLERQGEHETEKPLSLLLELVRLFTKEGDLVCDPFMGTGALALACAVTNRRYVGIELDQRFYKIACARMDGLFMGAEERQRHIVKALGELMPPGPLFSDPVESAEK